VPIADTAEDVQLAVRLEGIRALGRDKSDDTVDRWFDGEVFVGVDELSDFVTVLNGLTKGIGA